MTSASDANSDARRGRFPQGPWKSQLALATMVVAVVYLGVARWVPLRVQNVLFVLAVLLPIALNVAGWRTFKKTSHGTSLARWRRVAVRVGLLANCLAIAAPWGAFLWAVYGFSRHWQPSMGYLLDWDKVLVGILLLSVVSLAAGLIAGGGWMRTLLVVNSLITSLFVLSIPIGV